MKRLLRRLGRFFVELRRRHVYQVAVAYIAATFVVVQLADAGSSAFAFPPWFEPMIWVLAGLGFPIVLVIAWAFDLTSEGVRMTPPPQENPPREHAPEEVPSHAERQKEDEGSGQYLRAVHGGIAVGLIGIVIVITFLAVWMFVPSQQASEEAAPPIASRSAASSSFRSGAQASRGMVVLPCAKAERNPSSQVLCTGLMAAMTDRFTQMQDQLEGWWVVPAGEVRDRSATTPAEAQKWYNAGRVLTGDVQRENRQIRVSLTLLDGATLQPADTAVLRVPMANLTAVPADAANRVARLLGGRPLFQRSEVNNAGTVVPGAHEAYLRGRGHLWNYETEERLNAAIASFQRAVEEDPTYGRAHAGLGESYWRKYEATQDARWISKARKHCERALALDDQLSAPYRTLGFIHRHEGRYDEAVGALQKALNIHPSQAEAYQQLAENYEAWGRPEEAESAYQAVIYRWPEYWVGYNDLGRFYLNQGRLEAAATQFRQAVDATPEHFRPFNNLATLYHYMGKLEEAREMYEQLLKMKPNPNAYSNLGTIHFQQGRYATAARMYEQALDLKSDSYALWGNLADAYYWAGEREIARIYYRRAAELAESRRTTNLQDVELLCDLSGYFAMLGKSDKALSLIDQVLAQAGDQVGGQVAFRVAEVYEQLGRRSQALTWIQKALEHGHPMEQVERAPGLRKLRADSRFQDISADAKGIRHSAGRTIDRAGPRHRTATEDAL